jgi:acyl-CoA thioesterase I
MMRNVVLLGWMATALACGEGENPDVVRSEGTEGSPASISERDSERIVAGERPSVNRPRIVFLGTSLTEGVGLRDDRDAYPWVIQEKIDSAGLEFEVVNAGVGGETSAGGMRRIDWILRSPLDVLVVELGANDGLRGQDPEAMRRNLETILVRTRERYPDAAIVLAGMEAPPNLGPRYTEAFRSVFTDLAREHGTELIPLILEGVGGVRELNLADGIHPNPEGHRMMAATVWEVLEPVLRERASR